MIRNVPISVGGNVAALEPYFPILHPGKGLLEIDLVVTDRLYLGSGQRDPGLVPVQDFVVEERLLVTDDDFISGNFDTDFVRRRIEPLFCEEVELLPIEALISAIAQELLTSGCAYGYRLPSYGTDDDYDPWQLSVPWRLGGLSMRFQYTYLDKLILAYASRCPGLGLWEIQVSEKAYKLGIEIDLDDLVHVVPRPQSAPPPRHVRELVRKPLEQVPGEHPMPLALPFERTLAGSAGKHRTGCRRPSTIGCKFRDKIF